MWMFRVSELQSKLDDATAERRSLADSASSPVDDELRNVSDTSFSSDRPPAFRPLLPPPRPPPFFFPYRHSPAFVPPFFGRRVPPPDRLHSPPAFDAYRSGDTFVRELPRPRNVSPPGGRPSEHHRSAPPFDSHREESYLGRSPPPRGNFPPVASCREPSYMGRSPPPPPRGNSPPYYDDRHGGRRSPASVDGSHYESSMQRRDRHNRQDRQRTPDDEPLNTPPGSSQVRSRPVHGENRYQQSYPSHYSSQIGPDARRTNARSPPRRSQSPDDNYPTY